ncbi:response regulator [Roseburia sp. BX1005]|uniref:Stage 0 sporulation protein A homolog n=1 Tax=Roseburia zhanii TaxID=2763064 RepID=A0A923LNY0_9FIRM|nr:response regulator [Roseburia zhanii]MBC5713787.1 response regulator [Roseburia zhanii]
MKLEDAKILIGDDSILARKQLKDIISSLGGRNFLDASNGQEVIDIYKEQSPEVVFLDIVMPVKDGNTAIAEIMEFDPKADIVIVSSVGTQSQLKQAIQLGAKDFLQKPLNRRQIESILNNRFEGR